MEEGDKCMMSHVYACPSHLFIYLFLLEMYSIFS